MCQISIALLKTHWLWHQRRSVLPMLGYEGSGGYNSEEPPTGEESIHLVGRNLRKFTLSSFVFVYAFIWALPDLSAVQSCLSCCHSSGVWSVEKSTKCPCVPKLVCTIRMRMYIYSLTDMFAVSSQVAAWCSALRISFVNDRSAPWAIISRTWFKMSWEFYLYLVRQSHDCNSEMSLVHSSKIFLKLLSASSWPRIAKPWCAKLRNEDNVARSAFLVSLFPFASLFPMQKRCSRPLSHLLPCSMQCGANLKPEYSEFFQKLPSS